MDSDGQCFTFYFKFIYESQIQFPDSFDHDSDKQSKSL